MNTKLLGYSTPADDYERELEEFINKGKFVSMPKKQFEKYKKELQEAARNHIARRKSMTIRVENNILSSVKEKAKKEGIPYQTLLNLLISQYAQGKIKLAIG
ncbi:MAG TPA: CopG family antitoxin [Alphaproteobacteria bacterium]|jgi:predicted DNA binding CopG/RHH family protein|nr:CopG family antitoxin [Alphaproteobacteria bacterium]